MQKSSFYASFWEHLEDLRHLFFRVLFVITGGMILAFVFSDKIIQGVSYPLNNSPFEKYEVIVERVSNSSQYPLVYKLNSNQTLLNYTKGVQLISENVVNIPPGSSINYESLKPIKFLMILGPLDGMLAAFKVAFWLGVVGTSPLWVWFILRFLAPAMTEQEKALIWPFFLLSGLFLACGMSFAFFVTIPLANEYLMTFNESIATNLWSLSNYLDYTIVLVLGHGLGFELGLVMLMLVRLGFLTSEMLVSKRRYFIVFAFILAALLTPPDVLTQFMLAVPMVILYEITIIYAKMREKFRSDLSNLNYT